MIVAANCALAFATSHRDHELPWSRAKIAGFVCELAHDYYEDADKPIASGLADAAKIKSMKAPDGSYVFPRAEEVGRAFAAELLSMDSVRFASPN